MYWKEDHFWASEPEAGVDSQVFEGILGRGISARQVSPRGLKPKGEIFMHIIIEK